MVVAFRLVGSVLGELMPGYPPALLAVIAASAVPVEAKRTRAAAANKRILILLYVRTRT